MNIETVKVDDMNYLVSVESDILPSTLVHEIKAEYFDNMNMVMVEFESFKMPSKSR